MVEIQLVSPNTSVQDYAGWCLRFTQAVYGAPARFPTAWEAWLNTSLKHTDRDLPSVSVPVWFESWGDFGFGEYKNWGHACAWIPGRGILSSPASGYGQTWFSSIEDAERRWGMKFAGWSEDINGLRVAQVDGSSKQGGGNAKMLMIHKPSGDNNQWRFAVFATGFWLEFVGQDAANQFAKQIGASSLQVSENFWNHCKKAAQAPVNVSGISGGTTVPSVDAASIAKAVNDDVAKRMQA